MNVTLAAYSLVAAYSAAVVYIIAFIAFTLDLAKRSAEASEPAAVQVPARATMLASAAAGTGTALLERTDAPPKRPASRYQRVGLALTIVAFAVHLASDILRGIAAHRVPWANMFEFSLTGTAIIVGVFLLAQLWQDLKFLGAYVTGMVVILLMIGNINFYVDVVPLPPSLQSGWLVIHVLVAILGTAFFCIAAGLSFVQLLQERREAGKDPQLKFLDSMPRAERLENLSYRVVVVGFVFWTFTLIAGAIWAEKAWGRYWGWDTKEVWTFIIWVLFAGYLHARATRGWRGSRSAWLVIIGFAATAFNFTVVNLFFHGLHSYSGL